MRRRRSGDYLEEAGGSVPHPLRPAAERGAELGAGGYAEPGVGASGGGGGGLKLRSNFSQVPVVHAALRNP